MSAAGAAPGDPSPARDESGALERLRGQYAALLRKVSHDLRTPLVALSFQAQILERLLDDRDPNKQRAATIIALTREFTAVVDRLVETSRLEAGLTTPDLARVALDELVQALVKSEFQDDSGRIRVTAGALLPAMLGDRRLIQTAVRALLDRAKRASGASVDVEISHSGPELRIIVRDQGPPLVLPGSASTLEKGGTPDDLYLVRLVAELHGGRAWIESRPDHGNAVTVALPLVPNAGSPTGGRE